MPRGGVREGAGRPTIDNQERKQHQLRCSEAEWELLRAFDKILKYGQRDVASKMRDLTDKVIEHCSRVPTDSKTDK